MDSSWLSFPLDRSLARYRPLMRRQRAKMNADRDLSEVEHWVGPRHSELVWLEQLEVSVEAALSLALRELFMVVLVERFCLTCLPPGQLRVSMIFRSPVCYSELASESPLQDVQSQAEMLVARQTTFALAGLLHVPRVEHVRALINPQDSLTCSMTIHAPLPSRRPPLLGNVNARRSLP